MITKAAIALILKFEGLDQPGKWPGGASGITLGHGYDLGYSTRQIFQRDWRQHFSAGQMTRLMGAIGVTGAAAQRLAPTFRDIVVTAAAAKDVLERVTLPTWEGMTAKTFPGADALPANAFGALVSLVFNRGTSLAGERRKEMAAIRTLVGRGGETRALLRAVASQVRAMKRLWVGKGLDGLLRRREAEARMIEAG